MSAKLTLRKNLARIVVAQACRFVDHAAVTPALPASELQLLPLSRAPAVRSSQAGSEA
ncbi:hypothetical protein ABH922_000144 [Rhodococcus sp. 27YEA15]